MDSRQALIFRLTATSLTNLIFNHGIIIMKFINVLILTVASTFAVADDSGDSGSSGSSWGDSASGNSQLAEARSLLEKEKYKAAIQALNAVTQQDYRNADAWNLLGFSHRKLGNMKRSAKYYKKALKLNPEHKGALEYQGELFISLNKLDQAKENLRLLDALCPDGCEQLTDLTEAIAKAES